MVAQTRHTGQPSPKKLAFREKLVSKGQSNDALLKKLKTLRSELAEMDQEVVDVTLFSNVRKELISSSIMLHKDRGVKAYAACCLADILRLYAPDAPSTQANCGISSNSFSYNSREMLLTITNAFTSSSPFPPLKVLFWSAIFRTRTSLCSASFATCLRSSDAICPRRSRLMGEIMVALIDESASLSNDMLEIIMAQFMNKSAVRAKNFPRVLLVPDAFILSVSNNGQTPTERCPLFHRYHRVQF